MTERAPHYGWAWLTLMALAALSYGAANLPLAALAMPTALTIAAVKVAVVLTRFMHIGRDRLAGVWPMLTAFCFVTVMGVLIVLELLHR